MKTALLINEEIVSSYPKDMHIKDREYKKAEKRVAFLRRCAMYVETNPNVEFLQKQLQERTALLSNIKGQYHDWARINRVVGDTEAKTKSRFNSVFEITKIRNQIEYLKYILA